MGTGNAGPVEFDLSGLAGEHGVEFSSEVVVLESVHNDRRDVDAGLKHHEYLVPGCVDFTSVDD